MIEEKLYNNSRYKRVFKKSTPKLMCFNHKCLSFFVIALHFYFLFLFLNSNSVPPFCISKKCCMCISTHISAVDYIMKHIIYTVFGALNMLINKLLISVMSNENIVCILADAWNFLQL